MPLTKIECDRATCPPGKNCARLADEKGMYLVSQPAPAGTGACPLSQDKCRLQISSG